MRFRETMRLRSLQSESQDDAAVAMLVGRVAGHCGHAVLAARVKREEATRTGPPSLSSGRQRQGASLFSGARLLQHRQAFPQKELTSTGETQAGWVVTRLNFKAKVGFVG